MHHTVPEVVWKHCHIRIKDGLVSMVKRERWPKSKKGVLTAVFPRGSGRPVSRARGTRQAIDWLHWSQLLEVSAEATALTHTHTRTLTRLLWPYSWHNDDQPVSAFGRPFPVVFGPVQNSGFSQRSPATRAAMELSYNVLSCPLKQKGVHWDTVGLPSFIYQFKLFNCNSFPSDRNRARYQTTCTEINVSVYPKSSSTKIYLWTYAYLLYLHRHYVLIRESK